MNSKKIGGCLLRGSKGGIFSTISRNHTKERLLGRCHSTMGPSQKPGAAGCVFIDRIERL